MAYKPVEINGSKMKEIYTLWLHVVRSHSEILGTDGISYTDAWKMVLAAFLVFDINLKYEIPNHIKKHLNAYFVK